MALVTVKLTNPDLALELPGGYLLYGVRQREVDGADTYVQALLAAGLIAVVSTGGTPSVPTVSADVFMGPGEPTHTGPWLWVQTDPETGEPIDILVEA